MPPSQNTASRQASRTTDETRHRVALRRALTFSNGPAGRGAVTVRRMQQLDAEAIQRYGIPRLLLMEHAGVAVAGAVRRLLPAVSSGTVLVLCGTGYNGGDGLSTARHLCNAGYRVQVVLSGSMARLREEPAVFARAVRALGVPLVTWSKRQAPGIRRRIAACRLIVDALVGVGVEGILRSPVDWLIEEMNRSGKPILAVDVPSGLDADSGRILGSAVRATQTVTFGLAKRGCFIGDGPSCTGRLTVEPISMPAALLAKGAR